jgi:uncharacterized membrane protein
MSSKKNKIEEKRALITNEDKKKSAPTLVIAACIVVLAVGAFLLFKQGGLGGETAVSGQSEEIASQITYPVSTFDDGKAVHFEYTDNGITVKYFILKSSDGVIRAAFDACDVCWPAGKGYYQNGDDMVCRNCGRRFPSVNINEVSGGCNPAPLTRGISGDSLFIRVEDILEGKKYFDFSKL